VLDDTIGLVQKTSEFPDEDFGDLSKELSVVTDIPENVMPTAVPGSKTVLVVDDEPEIRLMLERLLKGKGYRVVATDNGRAALGMVKEHAPDLIVLDAMLPEVHGFDIARRIKASKRYGHIPIIMVSAVYRGWRFAEDLRESCGVEHYLEKPFKIADVLQAVERALEAEEEPSSSRVREMSAEAEHELNTGVSAYQEGRIDEAVAHLKRGIAIDPLAYRLHFHLGLLYGKKGQVYDAISELERAVEINSRHFPAVRNLAILYQKAGFRNKATETWERALNVAPDDVTRQSIKQHLLGLL
jgi:CheY-like chemotaxis protein